MSFVPILQSLLVASPSTSTSFALTPFANHDVHVLKHRRQRWNEPIQPNLNAGSFRSKLLLQLSISPFNEDNLSQMTVVELKDQLRQANLPVGGRKNELIDRLNEYYSTQDMKDDTSDDLTMSKTTDDVEASQDTPHIVQTNDDLESLTVATLKERLKTMGLPVGGRKADLIDRVRDEIQSAAANGKLSISQEDASSSDGFLDDALDDDDDEGCNTMDQFPPIKDNDNILLADESLDSESAQTRRARRKKYFKTQEVRELIRASDPRAPAVAEEMIAFLEQMAGDEENPDYLPGPQQYTALIDAYAKSDIVHAKEVIARIMESNVVELTVPMSNAIIGAYTNMGTREAAEQATSILERMEYLREFGDGSVKPTVYSYSLVISAWAKCGSFDAATFAENTLNRLLESYEQVVNQEGEDSVYAGELRPNSIVFNSVIDAWACSGSQEAGSKAEDLLHKMEVYSRLGHYDVRPDTITFNTCIKAWCNSNRADAPQKAEAILKKLETYPQYPRKNGILVVRPNLLSYNTVINSWAKSMHSDSAIRAQKLLTRMITTYKTEAFSTMKPDVVSFSSVLNALAKSKTVKFKADKCLTILKSMIDLHEVGDVIV
eukprot:g12230.t1.1.5e17418b g12230  g12230.t1 contig6:1503044-1505148(-)